MSLAVYDYFVINIFMDIYCVYLVQPIVLLVSSNILNSNSITFHTSLKKIINQRLIFFFIQEGGMHIASITTKIIMYLMKNILFLHTFYRSFSAQHLLVTKCQSLSFQLQMIFQIVVLVHCKSKDINIGESTFTKHYKVMSLENYLVV